MTRSVTTAPTLGLRVGDLVEVRSVEEILATLDGKGELENLPFMPEMVRFCGQRMTVHKVAHKLCDTISRSGIRKMENSVHLAGARAGHDIVAERHVFPGDRDAIRRVSVITALTILASLAER